MKNCSGKRRHTNLGKATELIYGVEQEERCRDNARLVIDVPGRERLQITGNLHMVQPLIRL